MSDFSEEFWASADIVQWALHGDLVWMAKCPRCAALVGGQAHEGQFEVDLERHAQYHNDNDSRLEALEGLVIP